MRESMELLKRYLSFKDYWIISMFRYLNIEIGNVNYEIDKETLAILCLYLKNREHKILKEIWSEKSIQHDMFEFCDYAYDYFSKTLIPSKREFEEKMLERLKFSPIKNLLLSFYEEFNYQYKVRMSEKDFYYTLFDKDYDIYYLKDVEGIELKEIYNYGDMFFYIVVDGIVEYEKKLIPEKNMLVTMKKSKDLNLKSFVNKASVIIFVFKKEFLNKLNIVFEVEETKIYRIYNMSIFNMILNSKIEDNKTRQILFQAMLYLLEKVKGEKNKILNYEWIKYKADIIKFVENNDNLDEKELGKFLIRELNMSMAKIYMVFKFLFDTTPAKLIEREKISKSYKLLLESEKSIEEIADELGYTLKTFVRKFEGASGYSPSKFRKIMRDY